MTLDQVKALSDEELRGPIPLKSAEWIFPLGSCRAALSIQADEDGTIVAEDMDALIEMAEILKRQLVRRESRTMEGAK